MLIALVGHASDMVGGTITYQKNFYQFIETIIKKNKDIKCININIGNSKNEYNYSIKIIDKIKIFLNVSVIMTILLKKIPFHNMGFEKYLAKKNVDLIIFTSPNELALTLTNKTFITTIWDLAHREFPFIDEFSYNFRFNLREIYYSFTIKKSYCVLVDSKETATSIEKMYGKRIDDICVVGLPLFLKSNSKNTSDLKNLDSYVIYPANFWKHKNHIFLLKCFSNVVKKFENAKLILVGEPKNNYLAVKESIGKLQLENNVILKSNLDYDSVIELIKNSRGLVYPSILGPTNYPPLEASAVGVKALLSDSNTGIKLNRNLIKIPQFDEINWTKQMLNLFKSKPIRFSPKQNKSISEINKLEKKINEFSKFNNYVI